MGVTQFYHSPETILFALDLHSEMASEVSRGLSKMDAVKHAMTNFVLAKKRLSAQHKFGIITLQKGTATLLPFTVTSNTDDFLAHLAQMQPENAQQSSSSSSNSGGSSVFDLGSLITAVAPLQQQHKQQQEQQQEGQDHVVLCLPHGSLLVPPAAAAASVTSTPGSQYQQSQRQLQLRVILIYGRSCLPAPALLTNKQQGLALDCLYVHDRPQPGFNQPQEVYSALEDLVDGIAVRAGHAGFIYEAGTGRLGKLLSCMAMMLAHPLQRRPQSATQAPIDLSTAAIMPLPSDAANLASGVPIMSPGRIAALPGAAMNWSAAAKAAAAAGTSDQAAAAAGTAGWVPAAASAWSKPLAVAGGSAAAATGTHLGPYSSWSDLPSAAAGAGDSSSSAWGDAGAAGSAAAAAIPWDEPRGGLSSGMVVLGQKPGAAQSRDPLAAASSGSSGVVAQSPWASSSSKPHTVVTGVPAELVQGTPEEFQEEAYNLDEGVVLGYAAPSASIGASSSAAGISSSGGHATAAESAGASSSAAQREVLEAAAAGGGLGDDELEGLAAALMATEVVEHCSPDMGSGKVDPSVLNSLPPQEEEQEQQFLLR